MAKPLSSPAPLPAGLVPGARVALIANGRVGTITRVIDAAGHMAGIVEVRWDGQRVSRTAGFFGGVEVRAL